MGPDFEQPKALAPPSWSASPIRSNPAFTQLPSRVVTGPMDATWWRAFNDPVLTSLEERAAKANLSLRTAALRLTQSRAQRGIAAADQFPLLRGNASYTRAKPSEKGVFSIMSSLLGGGSTASAASGAGLGAAANGTGIGVIAAPAANIKPFNLWQYGFDASWELDLWGRVRREVESADASVEASGEAQRDLLISVMAEVARDYIELRRVQRLLTLTRENAVLAQESLTLTEQRAESGLVNDLEVAEARTQLANIQAQIPQLDQQSAQAVNQLGLLLDEPPRALQTELTAPRPVPPVPPRVPIGLPSELARRRPDIRQAEAQLHAATADIGVAVADFYPRITLSGSVGMQALQFKDLGNWAARQYALGPSITLPIFEGGRLKATLELREAQQQEAAIVYHNTVLLAWHEVDNALTAYADEQRRNDALNQSVQSSRQTLDLARRRYRAGISNFLPVLDAQRTLLQAEQDYANSTSTLAADLVALYKALGGGWQSPEDGARADQPPR
ncbi:efflux transporter outer membrane subunit [Methylococcus geothermalis]|uniref:efflux transporter outer membrane subunit n=1 Tax=Methylococcus geothermalis TaxID=2681310 RepID=UPI001CB6BC8C|nr:efflux transporter outer membrane subunit [Methylococcus geothermalis]